MRRATSRQARPGGPGSRVSALLLALALAVGSAALGGCASQTNGVRATATPATPQPTKIAARAGDTRLCAVVSPAEVARAIGEAVDQVAPSATADALTGLQEVACVYLDTSDAQHLVGRGTINFEVAADPRAARDTFERVRQSFAGVSDVAGVGDAAFAGAPGGAEGGGAGLVAVRGPLLLYVSVGGDASFVARVATKLARLALERVAA